MKRWGWYQLLGASLVACTLPLLTSCGVADDGESAVRNDRIDQVLAMVECDQTYLWTDQPYAFAPMRGATCISGRETLRIRVYETGGAAALGLSDEVAVLGPDFDILAGDSWFVVAPPSLVDVVTREFADLAPVSKRSIEMLQQNPPPSDRRDMCVVAMSSIINALAEGNSDEAEEIAAGYSEVFPTAVEAAELTGSELADGDVPGLEIFQQKDVDPFAHDVRLAEIVSPLKEHCQTDVPQGQ